MLRITSFTHQTFIFEWQHSPIALNSIPSHWNHQIYQMQFVSVVKTFGKNKPLKLSQNQYLLLDGLE